jgi:hypothetical protein
VRAAADDADAAAPDSCAQRSVVKKRGVYQRPAKEVAALTKALATNPTAAVEQTP